MRKGDIIWGALFLGLCVMLAMPASRAAFIGFTQAHPLLGGFVKFAVLASMGELLAGRVGEGQWRFADYFLVRGVIWGFFGMLITMIFTVYATGVAALQSTGLLPFDGAALAFAFFVSALMNLTFAPTFMYAHRISDTYLDLRAQGVENRSLSDVVARIDTRGFVTFVVGRTVPLFWIPAHTATFLLPGEYRVLAAAMLSIALGLILTLAKKRRTQS